MTLAELWKQQRENHFGYSNINKYHEQGFKGKGINFLNLEAYPGKDNHGAKVCKVFSEVAPEANVYSGIISNTNNGSEMTSCGLIVDGIFYDFETFVLEHNIKIMNSSKTGGTESTSQFIKKYIVEKHDIIFTAAAGNTYEGVSCPYKNSAIVVAAVNYENGEINHESYSGEGEEVDFSAFAHLYNGTSFAAPYLLGEITLLLNKFGDFNQVECIEILKSCSIDLGDIGDDYSFGWGIPVLPLTDKLEVLEKLRGAEEMQFKDVEDTRWSKAAIDRCVDEGLLVGFEDGTFRPTENVTREQFATILTRILDKIEGR
ncbi:MAG: S-layer homology domain-containing protein [Sedimentibacter sp.]|uniref:S8 family peptidase n=1 Tax=Sedimentibacter sp. TaxID=1960295 RepID=UPI0029821356|nr:S8 family serine peptidase [Sedimentibacter sp.]MDW5300765.1 S-layer homology domain-containing protein [Sedimentibacter sp.]